MVGKKEYTRGEIAGGWVYISRGKTPIALVHPKYVDKFLAAPILYEALKNFVWDLKQGAMPTKEDIEFVEKILAKVESK